MIAGVVDTGDKFIGGDNDTGDKFIAGDIDARVSMSPAINLSLGCLWRCLFMAVRIKLSAAMSDFGGWRYCRLSLRQFWRPQEPLIRVQGCLWMRLLIFMKIRGDIL